MTSAPGRQLRATAMNALAHGADSLYTPLADEASRAAALRGAELIAEALDQAPDARDRAALSLGALLCGLAVDRAGIALHHVIGQSAVRVLGTPTETHAPSSRTRWRRCAIALGRMTTLPGPSVRVHGDPSGSPTWPATAVSASSARIATASTSCSTLPWRARSSAT